MVQLEIIFQVLPHKQKEFSQTINNLCDPDLFRKKGEYPVIYRAPDDENIYCYLVEWNSKKDLDAHMNSEQFEMLVGAMKVLGEIQVAQIHEINRTQVLEL